MQTFQSPEETCQQPLRSLCILPHLLCFSVAEYCCPIWSQSHHCNKVDTSLNECLSLVSGCIKFTPTELLPILSGIEPVLVRQNKNILSLCIRAMESIHISHQTTISTVTNVRPKSRMPLSPRMHHLSHNIDDIPLEDWAQHIWRVPWEKSNYQLKNFNACQSSKPTGYDLKRSQWVLLNRLGSGIGQYASFIHRIGLRENANIVYVVQFKLLNKY